MGGIRVNGDSELCDRVSLRLPLKLRGMRPLTLDLLIALAMQLADRLVSLLQCLKTWLKRISDGELAIIVVSVAAFETVLHLLDGGDELVRLFS
jgi:hypothetical protein